MTTVDNGGLLRSNDSNLTTFDNGELYLECGKVNDTVDPLAPCVRLGKDLPQRVLKNDNIDKTSLIKSSNLVGNIRLEECHRLPRKLLHSEDRLRIHRT